MLQKDDLLTSEDIANGAVLDAGLFDDLHDVGGQIMEGGDPAAGLNVQFFLNNLDIHCSVPPKKYVWWKNELTN